MSFAIFKQNMLSYMQNQGGINSYRDFAKKFVTEYDLAVRRGFQTINNIPLSVDNKVSMEQLANLACSTSLTKKGPDQHTFIDDLGKAVIGYWTGASLITGVPPIIPAIGSFLNITSVYATVTKPGIFPVVGPIPPTNDTNVFLDRLIGAMQQHATTIEGLYMTISLYPGFPLVPPAPGILFWTGWTIPPAKPSAPSTDIDSDNLQSQNLINGNNFMNALMKIGNAILEGLKMNDEDKEEARKEAEEADKVANDTTLPQSGRSSASEYSSLRNSEISSGERNAAVVELSDEELAEIEKSTPEDAKCEQGTKIVAIAKRDIGILETGTPPGLNYGGFPGGVQERKPGRIDEMFSNVGLDNQAKVRSTGSGYYWCAAAVATWWQEAGLETPSGGASCDNWMKWGKQKGYWSTKPKIGAAILYGTSYDANHIGVVSGILADGTIISIEGNTSGGGFSRNGVGAFQKAANMKRVVGFVNPPDCS